ncbi:TspO/MBR family protein [Parachlamydia sp. AcF125]|uniref:TspO/MBR family protein n=1 Tax=Parachlamydia sp. AcF125 TaxID=2795736 RepID=UPI001BC9A452|nr:TspO/MBR family protein [Parachlamydia sp. AcF125]MBS4167831.1 Tryptophan-rich protein TspO [Parachlamydia sp. AcF125]
MNKTHPYSIGVLALFILLCLFVEVVGGWFTQVGVNTWYPTLLKPSWTPPTWVFGPIWTTLYLLMAISVWLIWNREQLSGYHFQPYFLFFSQLALNLAWSCLFFYLKSPGWALVDILLLEIVLSWTMGSFWQISRLAASLLAPYWLWTAYAASINAGIWWLNHS